MKQKQYFNWQQQQQQQQQQQGYPNRIDYPQAYQHPQPSIDDISRQDFTIRKPQERLTIQTTPPPTRPLTYKSSKSSFQFENAITNNSNKSNTSGILSFPSDQQANIRPPTAPYEQGISQFSKLNSFQPTKKTNNVESNNANYDSLSERSELNTAIHQQVNETKQMPSKVMETLNAPKQENAFKINFSFKTALDGYKITNLQSQNCQSEREKPNSNNAQSFKQHFSLMKQGQQQQVELQQQQQQFQQQQVQQFQQQPQQQQFQQQQHYMKQQYKPYSQPPSEPIQLLKTPQSSHQQQSQTQLLQTQQQQQQRNSHNSSQSQQSAYQRGSSPYNEAVHQKQHSHQSSFSNCQYKYYQQSEPPLQLTQQNQTNKLSFQQQVQSRQQQQAYAPVNDTTKSISGAHSIQQKQPISQFGIIGGNVNNPASEQQFQQSIQNENKLNIPNSSSSSLSAAAIGGSQAYQPTGAAAITTQPTYYPKFSIQNPRTTSTSPFDRVTVRNKSINSSTNTTTITTRTATTPLNNKPKDSTLVISKPIINPANFQDASFVPKTPTIPKRHMLDRPFAMPSDQARTPTRLREIVDNKVEMEVQRNSQNVQKYPDQNKQNEVEDRQERMFPKPSEQEMIQQRIDRGQHNEVLRNGQNKTDRDNVIVGDARNQNSKNNNSNNSSSTYNIHDQSKQETSYQYIAGKQAMPLKNPQSTDLDNTKNNAMTSKNDKTINTTNKPTLQGIQNETITTIQQPQGRHERGVSSYYGNQPSASNQQQRQKERNSSISVCQQQVLKQQNSDNKPQLHLRSNSKLAPKIIDDNPRTIAASILAKENQNQENTSEKQKDKQVANLSGAPTFRFPQPSHYDRDSFKSKRSSVQSQTVRSEGASIQQQQNYSQQGNGQQNSFLPSPNTYNMDTLSYQKISQVSTTSSNFLDSIKDISDTFIAKTTSFFNNNFSRNQPRLGCNCDSNLKENDTCSKAFAWLGKQYKRTELSSLKLTYENIKQTHIENMEKNEDQIEKDLKRTFPSLEMFQNPVHINQLRSLLRTVAKFDPAIGYVQGMNMIAASFLYHAEEYISFWLIQILFNRLEMRDIFMPSLPGLSKHIQLIDILTLTRIPDLYQHLCQEHITYDMFCSPWIFSLFGVVLTPQKLTLLYSELLEEGWLMFYKLVLAFLCYHKDQLFQQDMSEILMTLTQANYKFDQQEHWEQLIKYSKNVNLDANFINSMLNSYNPEKKQFVLKPQMF